MSKRRASKSRAGAATTKAKASRRPTTRSRPRTAIEALEASLRSARFDRRFPHLQLQVRRLGKLLAIQQETPNQEFPAGTCFLHAHLPTSESFCIRSLLEIDLSAATVVFAIHRDDVLEAGHVILPMEHLSWIGFPDTQVNLGVRFVGFHLPSKQKKPLVVKK